MLNNVNPELSELMNLLEGEITNCLAQSDQIWDIFSENIDRKMSREQMSHDIKLLI